MPYRAAAALAPRPRGTVARMSATISAVSLWARFGLVIACRTPRAVACALFCVGVAHSKLMSRLFCLLPSLWLTHGRRGAGGKNAFATNRWASCQEGLRGVPRYNVNWTYPFAFMFGFKCIAGWPDAEGEVVRTAPQLLISYRGNPSMGFQSSISRSPGRNREWNSIIPLDR